MLKTFFTKLRMALDLRNLKMLYRFNKELSKDKNYSFLNLFRAMWLVAEDEKIVKFNNVYIISSFLPPIPTRAFLQVFNAVPNKNTKFFEHANAKRTAPLSIFIAITDKCNYNCWHCSKANRDGGKDLSLATIKKLIRDLQDMGVAIIGFTGGEPLLRKDINEIISFVDDRSVSYLFTTGQNLSLKKAKELKKAGLFGVGISLDSNDKKSYDKLRGYKGAFDSALSAIDYCKKAGLYTMIQTVVTKKMLQNNDVWKMINFGGQLGVNEIRFLETMPTGRLINIKKENILTQKEREALIKIHEKANRSEKFPKVAVFAHTESSSQFGCGAGTQHSYIDSAGNLCPCDFVPLSFGNIKEGSIKSLWKEMNNIIGVPRENCFILEIYKNIQKKYKNSLPLEPKESKEICKNCRRMKRLPGFYEVFKEGRQ